MTAPTSSRPNASNVEPNSRFGPALKTSAYQSADTEPTSRERTQTLETTTRAEPTVPASARSAQTGVVEPVNRYAVAPKQSVIQPASTEAASGDHVQTYGQSTLADMPTPVSSRYTGNVESINRTVSASKISTLQPTGAEPLSRDRAQTYDTSTRTEAPAPISSRQLRRPSRTYQSDCVRFKGHSHCSLLVRNP